MTKVELMQKLLQEVASLQYGAGDTTVVIDKAKLYIKKCFGEESEYLKRIEELSFYPVIFTSDTPERVFVNSYNRGKAEFESVVKTMIEDLELSLVDTLNAPHHECGETQHARTSKKIFIVHGHNETIRIAVEAFVRSIGYEPIVLFKEPNKGQTIIEKIESSAKDVCFAIVLYTACDEGKAKEEKELKPRARQNVVFEHGYMCSKLGRDHVVALMEREVEQPGDLSGVVYVGFDGEGAWQVKIAKEMQAVGLKVEFEKIKL